MIDLAAAPTSDVSLAEAYHFADFTRANYRTLLRQAREHYVFRRFTEIDSTQRFVLWRHDVDNSVHSAVALARIEAEEGVRATYFFRLHSELYNLMELPVTALAREIVSLGHDVGLHLDTADYAIRSETDLHEPITWEAQILERVLGAPVVAVSFHQPSPALLSYQQIRYG